MRTIGCIVALLAASSAAAAQDFQAGSRAKGMGGSYTAFEDDPVSIWMNPAGISTQPGQMVVSYQSYIQYEVDQGSPDLQGLPEIGLLSPIIVPSLLGFVFPVGSPEHPMAIGVAFIRPTHLHMTYDSSPQDGIVDLVTDQSFVRFRTAFAIDFRRTAPGDGGLFTHFSFGGGADIGYTEWEQSAVTATTITPTSSDRQTNLGNGFGTLIGIYDNTESFKIDFGAAVNLGFDFHFQVRESENPVFRWPLMFSTGMTFHLFKGMPLRLTVDYQHLSWGQAVEPSAIPGVASFRSTDNFSFGGEYRIALKEDGSLNVYPRIGARLIEHFWPDDRFNLPAQGDKQLFIRTRGASAISSTIGFGLYWTTAEGRTRGIDAAWENSWGVGTADAMTMSFGYTHEY